MQEHKKFSINPLLIRFLVQFRKIIAEDARNERNFHVSWSDLT